MKLVAEIGQYLASPHTSVRDILERLNVLPDPFQMVVDAQGRLLGTVTDGDLRRGILRGISIDQPVSACMHAEPIVGTLGDDAANLALLKVVPFLPVVDREGRLVGVVAPAPTPNPIGDALVMAGGLGSRLGDRTRSTPKPLLSVGGRPILDRILLSLEQIGVRRIWISVHYLAPRIEEFVRTRKQASEIRLVHEAQQLGTAGALGILPTPPETPILVLNGDVLTRADFGALDTFHRGHGYDATIAVAHHRVQVPYGVVRHDEAGIFQGIEEKPVLRNFVAAGIYYLSPEMVALVPPQTRMDMPELLNEGRRIGLRVGLFPLHEYWADIGRPEDLEAADAHHRNAR